MRPKRWVLLFASLFAADGWAFCRAQSNDDNLMNYFVGDYELVGKSIGSGKAFIASARFRFDQQLRVAWQGAQGEVSGIGQLELCGGDDISVLRITLREHGQEYQAHCRYQSEFDNYARITCRVFDPDADDSADGESGLLAFFYRHSKDQD